VSREEQKRRFLRRIDEQERNWKFSPADIRERQHWDAYQKAFAEVLSNTSTEHAPWYVIPADRKWLMRLSAAAVILDQLARIDPKFPVIDDAARTAMLEAKAELLAEE
jgi:polyphosphate kinase 2 (PPK2 family)